VSSDIVQFIEPYDRPEPIITEVVASSDQNDQLVQNDEVLNDDQTKHSNHTNDEHIIENLTTSKDVQPRIIRILLLSCYQCPLHRSHWEILNQLRYTVEEVGNKGVEESQHLPLRTLLDYHWIELSSIIEFSSRIHTSSTLPASCSQYQVPPP
ncbi:hypothetical protein Tco_0645591, partial [Tanacetum coccineum]